MVKRVLRRIIPRKIIPRKIYEPIKRNLFLNKLKKQIEEVHRKFGFCVVFIATPTHGNLGDHAIVYAQQCFFSDHGLGEQIIEITSSQYLKYSLYIKQLLKDKDIIIIDGGGSMGTLWLHEEHKMQHIVKTFPNNPIFIFPQTIFYSNDENGKKEMLQSIEVYSAHSNLHICAREKESFDLMKKIYPNVDILLIPDIVLYINNIGESKSRNGVAFCFRTDKEKVLSDEKIEQIKYYIAHKGLSISWENTVINKTVTKKNRIKELKKKWNKFLSVELVITDRLHGMIFAAITSTPCIAFDNSSKKVGNVYKWIEDLDYVVFAKSDEELPQLIDKLLSKKESKFDNTNLKPYYEKLFLTIQNSQNK